ncbi:transcriptional regulator SlyA [Roseospira marina]|uniref:Transcriptional regulator SlyA n=1 Tax=Roseospira marina TaxID=140057 RepID=A0A5M6IHJ9_9PROT|nr:transcriptional regulator SlyA [Roseospira marina]KAA5607105.1 transcriptional regulator SlyA [Roseospira marina]MBB4312701.1 MarR family transcriptional regulator for hemolysin [Roseospira marina]MBB5086526.1 MarR family transcriptional regulator for hemolysin [Roseospira marina]
MALSSDAREQFGMTVGRIARLWRGEVDRRLAPMGLTQARWYLLLTLRRLAEDVTQKELAEAANIQGPTLVRTLDSLEKEGLIRRCPLPGDRRAKVVRLTDQANPVLDRIQAVGASVREEILDGIDPADLDACQRVFDRIGDRLTEIRARSHRSPFTPSASATDSN